MKQKRKPRTYKYKLIASSLLLFTQTFAGCAKQTDPASEPMEQTESTAELQKESTEISEGSIGVSEGSAESSEENKTTPDDSEDTRTPNDNHEEMIVTKECAIEEGILYRSASPCDNLYQRASYVDHLLSEAGISFILDLSDDGERIEEHFSESDFKSDYFKRLYDEGQVKGLKLTTDYSSEPFKEKLAEGLVAMEEAEGPYLIQCLEGKERTGFVCALLECLCGADYDEVETDFMRSFENYYGITESSQKENYDMLVRSFLEPMLWAMMGEEADVKKGDVETVDLKKMDLKEVNLKEVDLKICAERYLTEAGMTSEQIQKLRSKLTE